LDAVKTRQNQEGRAAGPKRVRVAKGVISECRNGNSFSENSPADRKHRDSFHELVRPRGEDHCWRCGNASWLAALPSCKRTQWPRIPWQDKCCECIMQLPARRRKAEGAADHCAGAITVEGTRASLLLRVRDRGDQASWDEFVELYGPLILRYLRYTRVPEDDVLDLVQDILQIVLNRIQTFRYDPGRSFRAWLRRVARNRAYRLFLERARGPTAAGGSDNLQLIQGLADSDEAEENLIERQWRKRRLEVAMKRVQADVRPSTWEAFRRTVLEHTPPETVAEQLGLTVGNVYVCKSRVLKRLRDTVEEIDV